MDLTIAALKKILLCASIFFCVALFPSHVHARDWNEIRIAVEGGFSPFNETAPNGALRGLDVDIGNAICAEMKLKCSWVKIEWEVMIPALISGKVDAILSSMTINDERRAKVDFTEKYYSTPLVLVAKAGSDIKPVKSALKGKKIGLTRGTVTDVFASRFWNSPDIEIVRYRVQDEADMDLAAGRLDAVLNDYWQSRGGFLRAQEGRNFAIAGGKIYGSTPEERKVIGEGAGIAVRKKDHKLKETLNRGIAFIRANGTYDKIVRKYFSEDIYGQ